MGNSVHVVKVGIADMNLVKAPDVIRTTGLGSCVGIIIYDPSKQIAGMAHIMLPSSTLAKQEEFNEAKYADTAVERLISLLAIEGAVRHRLTAKIAGGAQMFQFTSGTDLMRIGPRNVEAVKMELVRRRIPILGEDVGGNSGRTIEFDPLSGVLHIRTVNKGNMQI